MNWVGGSKQRLKRTEDERKKKDFFERQRQQRRLAPSEITEPTKSLDLISIKTVDKVNKNPWHIKKQGGEERLQSHVIDEKSRATHVDISPTFRHSNVHIGQYKHPKDVLNKALRGPLKVPSWSTQAKSATPGSLPSSSSGLDTLFGSKCEPSQNSTFLETKTPHVSRNSAFLETKTPHASRNSAFLESKTPSSFVNRTPARRSSFPEHHQNPSSLDKQQQHPFVKNPHSSSSHVDKKQYRQRSSFIDKTEQYLPSSGPSSRHLVQLSNVSNVSKSPRSVHVKRKLTQHGGELSESDLFNEMPEFNEKHDAMEHLNTSYHNGHMFQFSKPGSASRSSLHCENTSKKRKSTDSGLGDIDHSDLSISNSCYSKQTTSSMVHQTSLPAMVQPRNHRQIPRPKFLDISSNSDAPSSNIGDFGTQNISNNTVACDAQTSISLSPSHKPTAYSTTSSLTPGICFELNAKQLVTGPLPEDTTHRSAENNAFQQKPANLECNSLKSMSRDVSIARKKYTLDGSRDLFIEKQAKRSSYYESFDRSLNGTLGQSLDDSQQTMPGAQNNFQSICQETTMELHPVTQAEYRSEQRTFDYNNHHKIMKPGVSSSVHNSPGVSSSAHNSPGVSSSVHNSPEYQGEMSRGDHRTVPRDGIDDAKSGQRHMDLEQAPSLTSSSSFLLTYYTFLYHNYCVPSLALQTLMNSIQTMYLLQEVCNSDAETQTTAQIVTEETLDIQHSPGSQSPPPTDDEIIEFDDNMMVSELVIIESESFSQTQVLNTQCNEKNSGTSQRDENNIGQCFEQTEKELNKFENFVDDLLTCELEKSCDNIVPNPTQSTIESQPEVHFSAKMSGESTKVPTATVDIAEDSDFHLALDDTLEDMEICSHSEIVVSPIYSPTEPSSPRKQPSGPMIWPDERMFFEKLPSLPVENISQSIDITEKLDIDMINKRQISDRQDLDTSNLVLRISNKKPDKVSSSVVPKFVPKFTSQVPKFTSSQATRTRGSPEHPIHISSQHLSSSCDMINRPILIDDTPEAHSKYSSVARRTPKKSPFTMIVGRNQTKSSKSDVAAEPALALQELDKGTEGSTEPTEKDTKSIAFTPEKSHVFLSQSNSMLERYSKRAKRHHSEPSRTGKPDHVAAAGSSQPCLKINLSDRKRYNSASERLLSSLVTAEE